MSASTRRRVGVADLPGAAPGKHRDGVLLGGPEYFSFHNDVHRCLGTLNRPAGVARPVDLAKAAARIGISLDEYAQHVAALEKWCVTCKAWHPQWEFGVDRKQPDGLNRSCKEALREAQRRMYAARTATGGNA